MEYLRCMDDNDTRSLVRIDFASEAGVGAGGVLYIANGFLSSRSWLSMHHWGSLNA